MSKFLYPIKNLEIMPWIKYWLLKKTEGGKLPTEYQQVDYIEGKGSQYINSNFIANQDTRCILDMEYTTTTNGWIIGSRTSSTSADRYGLLKTTEGDRKSVV